MASRVVVGLFHSSGIAEDACHRLRTEGVASRDIALRVLKEVAPIPPTMEPEVEALSVDPRVLGNVRDSFARFIRNGETAVFVRALADEQVEFAADILKQYVPITIDIVTAADASERPGPV
jgi:hypothetical protein